MLKPYLTTYGSLLNIAKLEKALLMYINTADLNELEYEYVSEGDNRSIFITGYNDEEQELPVFEHPIVLTTLKGHVVTISDVRRYVKPVKELPARLSDIVKDVNSLEFIVLRNILTKDFVNSDISKYSAVFKSATSGMGLWLSSMVNTAVLLDPVESFNIEIIASVYANTLLYNHTEVKANIDTIIARVIGSKHVYKFSKNDIKELASSYIVTDAGGLEELIINLQNVLPPEKAEFITIDSLIGVLGNIWYGPGGSETPIIALEHMPTWLALMNSSIINRSYQKSRIGMLLDKHKRVIDAKAFAKHFENTLNGIRVD